MLLRADPSLAEVPDLTPEQLASLTRSVEQKQQKLEADINDYIKRKQDELRKYGRELVEQYRQMECAAPSRESARRDLKTSPPSAAGTPSSNTASEQAQSAQSSIEAKKLGPPETAKRTKHTRVHKREKELYGLVTPIFLPLLESGDSSPAKRRKEKEKKRQKEDKGEESGSLPQKTDQGSPPRNAEKTTESRRSKSKSREDKMEYGEEAVNNNESAKEKQRPDTEKEKKKKRSTVKKSSLRHSNSRSRRKRVSLVIDDQIVLPADNVVEAPLTSPSETTVSTASNSTNNSTTSLDDMIDPRLVPRHDTPVHQDPVHHSLPLPMTLPSTSPTKHTGHTLSASPSPIDHEAPQTATRTFLHPSPSKSDMSLPPHFSHSPIYADGSEIADELETAHLEHIESEFLDEDDIASPKSQDPAQLEPEDDFDTYVGGIHGSGVDDVDQAGSYGYPSSLGASYLESYMKSRPLSVRIAAAEKAGLGGVEKTEMLSGERKKETKEKGDEVDVRVGRVERVEDVRSKSRSMVVDDDMEVMGEMEGF